MTADPANPRLPPSCEVCIVGGGPAGLATSIALARHGFDVAVVDRAVPPIDKGCGEGLLPESLACLAQLGIELPNETGYPFRGIHFLDSDSSVRADFPSANAVGLRRTVLHQLLLRRAEQLGVTLLWGAKYVAITEEGISVNGRVLRAGSVVGADGQNSAVRRQSGLDQTKADRRRYGFRTRFRIPPWSPYMELHWGPACQIYVTPISSNEISVALISRDSHLRLNQALDWFPRLRQALHCAEAASPEMGALTAMRTLRRVTTNRIALVGEASGSVDAITGEGMCLAFQDAIALARVLKSGALRDFERLHRSIRRRPRVMAELMLMMDRNTAIRRNVLSAFERRPYLFSLLLSIHIGEHPFRDLTSRRFLQMCRSFVRA